MSEQTQQKGFSLVELLIVIVIIGIIAAIAVPSLIAARRTANEASAVSSLHLIHSSELTYQTTKGAGVFGSLAALNSAGLVDSVLSSGRKSGYSFDITTGTASGNQQRYATAATPTIATGIGMTGSHDFGVGSDGLIYIGEVGSITSESGGLMGATKLFDK